MLVLAVALGARYLAREAGSLRRNAIAHTVILMMGIAVLWTAAFACLIAQGFSDRAFWVLYAPGIWLFAVAYAQTLRVLFDVAYQSIGRKSTYSWLISDALRVLMALIVAPLGVAMPVAVLALGDPTDPNYDVASYNVAYVTCEGLLPSLLLVGTPLTTIVTNDLIRQIDDALASSNGALSPERTAAYKRARTRFWLLRLINVVSFPASLIVINTVLVGAAYAWRWSAITYTSAAVELMTGIAPLSQIVALTASSQVAPATTSASKYASAGASGSEWRALAPAVAADGVGQGRVAPSSTTAAESSTASPRTGPAEAP